MTKTLNQIFFFSPPKSEYFFQQHWESEYFFRKKTKKQPNTPPPLQVKWYVPYMDKEMFFNIIQKHSKATSRIWQQCMVCDI
jgi:hypothetical protein